MTQCINFWVENKYLLVVFCLSSFFFALLLMWLWDSCVKIGNSEYVKAGNKAATPA